MSNFMPIKEDDLYLFGKLIAKHDSKLLDKVGEYLFNSKYASEKIADLDYDQTVTFTKLDWMEIVEELKAEV